MNAKVFLEDISRPNDWESFKKLVNEKVISLEADRLCNHISHTLHSSVFYLLTTAEPEFGKECFWKM